MLKAGDRLGPYEVLVQIGAGGMGEVYRARDTRLGREVALKTLPEEFSGDTERLRRFEQEAKSASALNHPNIVTIFDIGREGTTSYLAMELVDGTSLRDVIESRPMATKKLLSIASQAAEPGETPVGWSRNGTALYVSPTNEVPARVVRIETSDGRRTPFKDLSPSDPAGVAAVDPIVVAPDGNAYAYSCLIYLSTLYLADGLR